MLEQPHLVLGDFLPTRNIMDADMPTALAWLEIMARLGFLRRNEGWARLFDRLLDDRDRHGVWHPPRSVTMPATVAAGRGRPCRCTTTAASRTTIRWTSPSGWVSSPSSPVGPLTFCERGRDLPGRRLAFRTTC